jgi:hypothetical protein
MSYSEELRWRVVRYVRQGGSQAQAARQFEVSVWCVKDWMPRGDHLTADKPGPPQGTNGTGRHCRQRSNSAMTPPWWRWPSSLTCLTMRSGMRSSGCRSVVKKDVVVGTSGLPSTAAQALPEGPGLSAHWQENLWFRLMRPGLTPAPKGTMAAPRRGTRSRARAVATSDPEPGSSAR